MVQIFLRYVLKHEIHVQAPINRQIFVRIRDAAVVNTREYVALCRCVCVCIRHKEDGEFFVSNAAWFEACHVPVQDAAQRTIFTGQ